MDLKKALEMAMKGEIEGRELYNVTAERTQDPNAREIFSFLSQEENSHFNALKTISHSYVKGEKIVVPELPRLVHFLDAESPIFSEDFKKGLEGKHFEMSALSIGLRLEYDASRFYRKMAESTEIKELKALFEELTQWENDHYNAFQKELNFLEDDYMMQNNFSPFL